jgi:hypothetical protein
MKKVPPAQNTNMKENFKPVPKRHKMQQSKGSHPVKRPQSRQPNYSNIFELLEEQEEEWENTNKFILLHLMGQ